MSKLTIVRNAIASAYGRPFQIRQAANLEENGAQIWIKNDAGRFVWSGSLAKFLYSLGFVGQVRDDVKECEYHRPPTVSELRFGEGATHYRTFTVEECCWPGTRLKREWFKADDGLRYYA